MIPFVRRERILELLTQSKVIYIDELVNEIGVSEATIRRDLKTLGEEGLIDLLSGGAAKLKVRAGEKPLNERIKYNKNKKEIIGEYAASLVEHNDFIFIGPGTTEHTLIPHLKNKKVTVVTNGTFHIPLLIEQQVEAIILGGRVNGELAVLSGPSAIEQVKKMRFDKCFIGGSGLTKNGVMACSDENVAMINSIAINNSNQVYFLVDSSKVGLESRFEFARLEKNYLLITNKSEVSFSDNVNCIRV